MCYSLHAPSCHTPKSFFFFFKVVLEKQRKLYLLPYPPKLEFIFYNYGFLIYQQFPYLEKNIGNWILSWLTNLGSFRLNFYTHDKDSECYWYKTILGLSLMSLAPLPLLFGTVVSMQLHPIIAIKKPQDRRQG